MARMLSGSTARLALGVITAFMLTGTARAADLLITDNSLWFDSQDKTPVNASAEIKGLTANQLANLFKNEFGARVERLSDNRLKIDSGLSHDLNVYVHNENGETFLVVAAKGVFHRDIVKLNKFLSNLQLFGATARAAELPLAVRVHDLKGQDDFVSSVTGLAKKTITEIDHAAARSAHEAKPVIFRYFLDDREKTDPADFKELQKYYEGSIVSVIPANTYGRMPLVIPGNSIVFHSRVFHASTILGRHNPGLVNSNLVQALTANKYVEARFWDQYAPGALPETHLLANMGLNLNDPRSMVARLNDRFPEGWVMKGTNESSSNFSIITDKTDVVKEIDAYQKSDFEAYRAETYRRLSGFDEDNIYETLQEHPNYRGWRMSLYLANPRNVVVQRKLDIDREFRVESIAGKILLKGTIDRHNWFLKWKGLPYEVSAPDIIAEAEAYAQEVVNKLPPELRETNFAFDIALLKKRPDESKRRFRVVESNAGSESGFLTNQDTSAEALNRELEKYPGLVTRKQLRGQGLTPKQQMDYLYDRFKTWGIDPKVQYKGYTYGTEHITTEFTPVTVAEKYKLSPAAYTMPAGSPGFCRALFH